MSTLYACQPVSPGIFHDYFPFFSVYRFLFCFGITFVSEYLKCGENMNDSELVKGETSWGFLSLIFYFIVVDISFSFYGQLHHGVVIIVMFSKQSF